MPPCPSPSWALVDEVEEVCAVGGHYEYIDEDPFALCPALYNYLEDVERYCEEMEILRGE